MNRTRLIALTIVLCLSAVACDTDDPAVAPSPSAAASGEATSSPEGDATPTTNPLILAEGTTTNGLNYQFRVLPGDPVCVQLRRVDELGDFMVCDERPAQEFNGAEGFRYTFGGLNPEQVPKFVIGITDDDVARVRVDLADVAGPEVATVTSSAAPDFRFFLVMLDPEPARHILAVRGLDSAGKTVEGFSLGEGEPSPLPTGV